MRVTKMVQRLGTATLAALALSFSATSSAVPSLLTQQGRLFDKATAEPVSGSVTLVFTLYDDAEASEPANVLWTETQSVTLDDGYFSAVLGEEEVLDPAIFDGSVRYLGVKVGADDEMTPRQAVTSVPYALAVPWAGIREHAAPCEAPEFLRGFDANGAPICAAPKLSCVTRYHEELVNGTTVSIGCEPGEILTGGGCLTKGTLRSSYHFVCERVLNPLCIINDPTYGHWKCEAAAATNMSAYARCCKIQ